MITGMVSAAAVLGGTGILVGLFLGFASEKFKVKTDQKATLIRSVLPGVNCGACGYAGCDALATAIAEGSAPVTGCTVGRQKTAEKVREIMNERL